MVKKAQGEPGFPVSYALLMLVIVLGVSIGLYAWIRKSPDNIRQPGQTEVQPRPSRTDSYLYIKEWGMRISLPEKLRGDITYAISESGVGSETQVLFFSRAISATAIDCTTYPSGYKKVIAVLYRHKVSGQNVPASTDSFKKIAGREYFLRPTSCKEALSEATVSLPYMQITTTLEQAITDTLQLN